jgi:hypothetical protein
MHWKISLIKHTALYVLISLEPSIFADELHRQLFAAELRRKVAGSPSVAFELPKGSFFTSDPNAEDGFHADIVSELWTF